ncbi:hypothetical protein ABK040_016109 [Willaertia magna]
MGNTSYIHEDLWSEIFCFLEIDDVIKNCLLTCRNFKNIISNENNLISQRINYLKQNFNSNIIFTSLSNVIPEYLFDFLTIACRKGVVAVSYDTLYKDKILDIKIKEEYWKSREFTISLISYSNYFLNSAKNYHNLDDVDFVKAAVKGYKFSDDYKPSNLFKFSKTYSSNSYSLIEPPIYYNFKKYFTKNNKEFLKLVLQKECSIIFHIQDLLKYFSIELLDVDIILLINLHYASVFAPMELMERLQQKLKENEDFLSFSKQVELICYIARNLEDPTTLWNEYLDSKFKNNPDILHDCMSHHTIKKRRMYYGHYYIYKAYPYLYLTAGKDAQLDVKITSFLFKRGLFKTVDEYLTFYKQIITNDNICKEVKYKFLEIFINEWNGKKQLNEVKQLLEEMEVDDFIFLLQNIHTHKSFLKMIPRKYWVDSELFQKVLQHGPWIKFTRKYNMVIKKYHKNNRDLGVFL